MIKIQKFPLYHTPIKYSKEVRKLANSVLKFFKRPLKFITEKDRNKLELCVITLENMMGS